MIFTIFHNIRVYIIFAFYINNKLIKTAFPITGPDVTYTHYHNGGCYGQNVKLAYDKTKQEIQFYTENYYSNNNEKNYTLTDYYNEFDYKQFIADKLIRALSSSNITNKLFNLIKDK